MKYIITLIILFASTNCIAQLEISTGYASNRLLADGAPIHIGYDIKIKNGFYTKSQIGYKYLSRFNDFVDATARFSIFELHQTFSYEIIRRKKYILKPNVGFNYRFYSFKAKINEPYNTRPQRAWIIARIRGTRVRLNSFDGDGTKIDNRKIKNHGYSFQSIPSTNPIFLY